VPTLACRICGRVVYTTATLDALLPEERRCPRCGAILDVERRSDNRRKSQRRSDTAGSVRLPAGEERRVSERRRKARRREDDRPLGGL
jgi:phage FluMu protein Com